MKILFFITVLLSAVLFFSCKKNSDTSEGGNSNLIGKWILVETLADPGDGSGKWRPVDRPNYYFIKFNADNSVESNTYGRLTDVKGYRLDNDSSITFLYTDGTNASFYYKISGSTLTVMGGCIEACGSKFIKQSP